MIMIFLMFKTWEGIPALQGVSATVRNAAKSLFSFSLILGCLIALFAGAGMLAFGQEMEGFHSLTESTVTTLIVMTTGTEEIYAEQHAIDPFLAALWHWLLVCIMYVVCLNLVLCILVDAYAETRLQKEEMANGDDPSLYEQSLDTVVYCAENARSFVRNVPRYFMEIGRCQKIKKKWKRPVEPDAVAASVIKKMGKNVSRVKPMSGLSARTMSMGSQSTADSESNEFEEDDSYWGLVGILSRMMVDMAWC